MKDKILEAVQISKTYGEGESAVQALKASDLTIWKGEFASIIGSSGSGKSTLLNLLSGSDALAEDRLFATLDPTARKVRLGKTDVVFFDTVGFIRDIPTDLIEAFKSTLSCIKNADFILNVCDLTRDFISQSETTERILKEIGVMSPVIKVYNKCDNIRDFTLCDKNAIIISARTGQGVDELKRRIENFFDEQFVECVIRLDYSKQDLFFRQKKSVSYTHLTLPTTPYV